MDSSPPPNPSMSCLPEAEGSESPAKANKSPKLPSLKIGNEQNAAGMTASSTPLGNINAARRPGLPAAPVRSSQLPQDVQARMKAFQLSRQGPPPGQPARSVSTTGTGTTAGSKIPSIASPPPNGLLSAGLSSPTSLNPNSPLAGGPGDFSPASGARPLPPNFNSAPVVPKMGQNPKKGLAAKRGMNMGMKLSDASGPSPAPQEKQSGSDVSSEKPAPPAGDKPDSLFNKYAEYVDTKTGTLRFKGKATLHGQGIEFSSGSSFNISLDEVDTLDELGKGNYGTVYKVRHSRPRIRKPGQGLSGNRAPTLPLESLDKDGEQDSPISPVASKTTGVVMAMKEIRLELDEAKFAAIIMELDILHRCVSPYIVDFYGAFFQEGAVYICMEFMDGGSIDKLYGDGVPEPVLRKIALATVIGLKSLKEEHNIIHRDVKPTNILVNTKGQVKICDFGVSGNLVASIAKTNIGCQSYMAPERISGGGVAQAGANPGGGTYSVQSDIWSLGLTIIECAMGQYPYPPETYDNIFSQLSAIVDGEPPDLPTDRFSEEARDFVRGALNKIPKLRPTYAMLLQHPWLSVMLKPPTIAEEDEEGDEPGDTGIASAPGVVDEEVSKWVLQALERKRNNSMTKKAKPALHAAPLDTVPNPA
ncbi:uncharacterized protein KY384_006530 [Bacidia gigantensis]|uniref:uncharacterized protein n=1 Tax=Bacidia gigantensis TaxID=2732470 RepID=UPI001D04E4FE|nr:uncharacterized protein KY384_006530 [Bacidia gigantensis]KAG8528841.1 hypothetical protein KY384_006530 [Bacidia gigantensis]